MKIEFVRRSPLTGKIHTREIELDPFDMEKYERGALIQDAFPYLTAGEREFIMTGTTEEEWDELFGGE